MKTRLWVCSLVILTTAIVLHSLSTLPELSAKDLMVAVALVALLVAVEHFDVTISVSSGPFSMSVGATIAMAAAFHFVPSVAVFIVLLAHLIDSAIAMRHVMKSMTNIGNYVCATFVGSTIYHQFAIADTSPLHSLHNIIWAIVASGAFVIFSTSTLALIVGPVVGMPFLDMWSQNIRATALETVGLPAIGGLVAVLADENAAAVLLVGFPLMAPQLAYKALNETRASIRSTVETLVDALEARDRSTADHSRQVATYTGRILEQMVEVPSQVTDTILWAARVHDLGKIAIRDSILFKAGRLEDTERDDMQRHPVLGADIVARLSQSDPVAIIIRHHHERWDGYGYPDGLAGAAIPLGSRIIAVADTFEAMTADRPYRRALPDAVAFAEIARNSGTQFDPAVVHAFERAFRPAVAPAEQNRHSAHLSPA